MTQPRQAHAVISREVARLRRPPTYPVHSGYAAIVAKAHDLGLPQCYATDITIHDRLLIIQLGRASSRGCSTAVIQSRFWAVMALADVLAFGRIARHYGVTAYVTMSCLCGNAGDAEINAPDARDDARCHGRT